MSLRMNVMKYINFSFFFSAMSNIAIANLLERRPVSQQIDQYICI